jgi:RsiW-degrading membrane proteinase PrsW (M82 family)
MSNIETDNVKIPLHRPGLREKLFFFTSGIIVSIPMAIFFEIYIVSFFASSIPSLYAELVSVGILAPIIEEFGKAYPLFFRHGETNKSIMNLGFLVGFGFGIVEFLEYVLVLHVPFIVRLPGILFHLSSTAIVGYGIASKKATAFYLVAVVLHAANNFAAVADPFQPLTVLIVMLTLYLSLYLYQRTPEKFIQY